MANVIKHKRGSGSDPSASDLILGELAIRTDTGKLFTKMDSGAIAEIAGGGSDIAINTLSSSSATGGGSATFNGSAYRFTLSAPPSVSAQQLLVSINGVIQKPVAGTGQPSEGFSVDGTDIILGDAPATGSDFFILTFKSLGVSEPADNSVTSAKIVDGAIVNADINASAAIAGTKISPDFGSQNIITTGTGQVNNTFTVNGLTAVLHLVDVNNDDDFSVGNYNGTFKIIDETNNVDRFKIDSDGTVDVTGNLDVGAGIDVTGAITGTGDLTIDTNTLHVDSSNNRVGIGTTSPGQLLDVVAASGDANFRVRTLGTGSGDDAVIRALIAGTTGSNYILFGDADDSNAGQIRYQHSNNSLQFTTNASEAMRIDSSGNLTFSMEASSNYPTQQIKWSNDSTTTNGFYIAQHSDRLGRIWHEQGLSIVFGTNNTERMRIHHDGNVGIGTTSPSQLLHLKKTGANALLFVERDSGALGFLEAQASKVTLGSSNNHPVHIVQNSGDALMIDSSKNVGIGTTSPDTELHVKGVGSILKLETTATTGSGYMSFNDADEEKAFIGLGSSINDSLSIWLRKNSDMRFATNNTERMTIDGSGNVGIGTTSPARGPLHVHENSSGDCQIHLTNNDTGSTSSDGLTIFTDTDTSGIWSREDVDFQIATNGTERLRIKSNGKVLIGTTSPQNNANADDLVVATGGHSGITIRSGTSHNGNIFFADGTTGADEYRGVVNYKHDDNAMSFSTNAAERMRIDSSGRLLVGTASAFNNLGFSTSAGIQAVGAYNVGSIVSVNNEANGNTCAYTSAKIRGTNAVSNGDVVGSHAFDGYDGGTFRTIARIDGVVSSAVSSNSISGELRFRTRDGSTQAERMRITSSGNVGIGTTSPISNLHIEDSSAVQARLKSTGGDSHIYVEAPNGSSAKLELFEAGTGGFTLQVGNDNALMFFDDSVERMRLKSDGDLLLTRQTAGGGNETLQITANHGSGSDQALQASNNLRFYTNGANERIRIDTSGNVLIGRTSTINGNQNTSTGTHINSNGLFQCAVNGDTCLALQRLNSNGSIIQFRRNTTSVGAIEVTTNSTAYNSGTSDRSVKKNFESWTENTLNLFKNINPQKFNYTHEDDGEEKTKGFVAQDMVSSFPEAYPKNDDDIYMFNPSGMVVYLMKALQEAVARIEALEAT